MARNQPDTLIVGRILSTHGLRGEIKVQPLTDDPERISSLDYVLVAEHEYGIESVRQGPNHLLVRLSGVSSVDEASELRGEYMRVRAEDAAPLPEGAYYHFQILGLRVETTRGEEIGSVDEVMPLEANDVYVVRGGPQEVLVPAIRDVVKDIDLEAGRMVIEPIPGLLPWEQA